MGKHNTLGLAQQVKVAETIRPILEGPDADGFWSYIEAHTDVSVADALTNDGTVVTSSNVAHVRRELFGPLRSPTTRGGSSAGQIAALTAKVEALSEMLYNTRRDHAQFAKHIGTTLTDLNIRMDRVSAVKLGEKS